MQLSLRVHDADTWSDAQPLWDVWVGQLHNGVVELHVLLIPNTSLVPRKPLVLFKNGHQGPALKETQTRHHGPGAVLALVAVNEERQIACVAERGLNAVHQGLSDVVERLLVAFGREAEHVDAVLLAKLQIALRVVFRAEVEDATETQCAKKGVVLFGRVTAAVHPWTHHGKVDGGHERLLRSR